MSFIGSLTDFASGIEQQFSSFSSFFGGGDNGYDDINDYEGSYEEQLNGSDYGNIDTVADKMIDRAPVSEYPEPYPRDSQWVRLSFVLQTDYGNNIPLNNDDLSNRAYSSATLKYTDTSVGGNVCINPPPQFTRYSDIRDKGYRGNTKETSLNFARSSLGMGRYYSEAIDDNNQIIHLSFGVPSFSSFLGFFLGFYSDDQSRMARTGRYDDSMVGSIAYGASIVLAACIAPLFLIPFAVAGLEMAARLIFNKSSSKYYSFKPTMYNYWAAVDGIINQLSVNMGITYPTNYGRREGDTSSNVSEINLISTFMPNEFSKDGKLNVLGIANKAKVMQMNFERNLAISIEEARKSRKEPTKAIYEALNNNSILIGTTRRQSVSQLSLEGYIRSLLEDTIKRVDDTSVADLIQRVVGDEKPEDIEINVGKESVEEVREESLKWWDYYIASEGDASRWASFRVDYTGTVSESFTNAVTEIPTATFINSMSKKAREARYSLSDGNFSEILSGAVNLVKQIATDTLSHFHLGGLMALAGNAYVEIPKIYDSSNATINRSTYTMTLSSPYGNPVSQLLNIYLPLSMLLAGALPLSTGRQSYTSPFICQLHDRGRGMTRLGIIDSLSISRGTSNLGFNNEGKAMAIEVSFSVLDLSNIVHVPISSGVTSLFPDMGDLVDGENSLTDYLKSLSGSTLADSVYMSAKITNKFKRTKANWDTFLSPASFGTWLANNVGTGAINAILRGTDKK